MEYDFGARPNRYEPYCVAVVFVIVVVDDDDAGISKLYKM
jgi:hypothetical protein